MEQGMFDQSPHRMIAIYNEGARAIQGITAEMGDHSQRLIADSTATLAQMAKAQSAPQFMDVMMAFSKRAFEENTQHMSRIAAMYAAAVGDQTRALQSIMLPGQR
jgi:hypothetical protein